MNALFASPSCLVYVYSIGADGTSTLIHGNGDDSPALAGQITVHLDGGAPARSVRVLVKEPDGTRWHGVADIDAGTAPEGLECVLERARQVSGSVVSSGHPVSGALVTLYPDRSAPSQANGSGANWVQEITTGNDGGFSIEVGQTQPLCVDARHDRFGVSEVHTAIPSAEPSEGGPVLALKQMSCIRGRILERDGESAIDMVLFFRNSDSALRMRCRTRRDGTFFVACPPGRYAVWPEAPERSAGWEVEDSEGLQSLTLPERFPVSFLVSSKADGSAILDFGAGVYLALSDGRTFKVSETDPGSHWEPKGLRLLAGTYVFTVKAPGYRDYRSAPAELGPGKPVVIEAHLDARR